MESEFSKRNKSEMVKRIVELASKEGVISLAGGLPDPRTFPDLEFKQEGRQYGLTEGLPDLRSRIAGMEEKEGVSGNVMITSGSQQGIDLLTRTFINPGDVVITEKSTYLAALQVFRSYGADVVGVESDKDGILPDDLEKEIRRRKPKFVYLVPDFANPAGTLMGKRRREEVAEVLNEHGVMLVEDTAYRRLWYDSEPPSPLSSLAEKFIYLGTFSKTICPGLRIGYVIAKEETYSALVRTKQTADICTSPVAQYMVLRFLDRFEKHVEFLRSFYKKKRDAMEKALKSIGVEASTPGGGFFFWLKTDKDTTALLEDAVNKGVAYVPGEVFRTDGDKRYMRLSFSLPTEDEIRLGIERLGKVLG